MPQTLPAAAPGVLDTVPVDLTELLCRAYTLGDMIKRSAMADEYVYWKQVVERDEEAKRIARRLSDAKNKFAECERFGRFHPDYNEALDRLYAVQAELDALESVRRFKDAERELDTLLHEISFAVARAVSESVKVPDGDPNAKGCGSGGSCSCGGGGCG
ncbi:YlbF family regulator [Cohnella pontilimi]|uniref:YlbF family regulator n=2 Tax=Cohnella pontilimi TaxID=2564100 RepID=A0A4V5LSL6_9BACL|nr:YlbF family regulator [Cohnella pontilimi]TJY43589.1 YlbF family regulator [Cohnella pontilimi]